LLERVSEKGLSVRIDVLRPPTFTRLREHLRCRRGFYHLVGQGRADSPTFSTSPGSSFRGCPTRRLTGGATQWPPVWGTWSSCCEVGVR